MIKYKIDAQLLFVPTNPNNFNLNTSLFTEPNQTKMSQQVAQQQQKKQQKQMTGWKTVGKSENFEEIKKQKKRAIVR